MGTTQKSSNRRIATFAGGVVTAGALLFAGPAATALAAPAPDYSVDGFFKNLGAVGSALNKNAGAFGSALNKNAGNFGNAVNKNGGAFGSALGANAGAVGNQLNKRIGTFLNNLVGNPSNAGGSTTTTTTGKTSGSFQTTTGK